MEPRDLLRWPMRLWYEAALSRSDTIPAPRDEPRWSSGFPGADRVLLLGNGPCQGWGVTTHQLALTGQLGRAVERLTGRGCDVDYVGDETTTVDSVGARLQAWPSRDYGAVVVILGINDAVRLTAPSRWRDRLRSLLTRLVQELPDGSPIVLGDIPPLASLPGYANAIGRLTQPRADALNAVVHELARTMDRVRLVTVPPPPRNDDTDVDAAVAGYQHLAALLADACAPALPRSLSRPAAG